MSEQPDRDGRPVAGRAARQRECGVPDARDRSARDRDEQRHAKRGAGGSDENLLQLAAGGGRVAAALLAARRAGIRRAGAVHRQPLRRAAGRAARRAVHGAAAGAAGAAGAGAQRARVLPEDLRQPGRVVHGDERAQRLQQDLPSDCDELTDTAMRPRGRASQRFSVRVGGLICGG